MCSIKVFQYPCKHGQMRILKCSRFFDDIVCRVTRWEDLKHFKDVIEKNHKIHWQCKDFEGIDYIKGFSDCEDKGLCSKRPDWCVRFLTDEYRQLMALDKNGLVVEYEEDGPVHQGHQEQQAHQEHQKRQEHQEQQTHQQHQKH